MCDEREIEYRPPLLSNIYYFVYYQGKDYAQNWHNCDPTASGHEKPNLNWASINYHDVPPSGVESWTSGVTWGNSFSLEPNVYVSPNYVSFVMRCQ